MCEWTPMKGVGFDTIRGSLCLRDPPSINYQHPNLDALKHTEPLNLFIDFINASIV